MDAVSVCMLTYKGDILPNVKLALESLYNQSYKKIDIYIQEDGIIQQDVHNFLLEELSNGRIAHLETSKVNQGIARSRNNLTNIVLLKGYQYIAVMDSDDMCMPERIEKQLKFMQDNPDIDVCGTYIEEFGDGIQYHKIVTYPLKHKDMLSRFQSRVPLANVTSMFRRSFFEKAGMYAVNGHINNEDTLMWMKGFMHGCRFANIAYIGVKVRVSRDFFNRRGGLKKAWSDFKNRLRVNRTLGFGPLAYGYACATFVVNLLPAFMKKYAYKYLR